MGRGVMTVSDATAIVYVNLPDYDGDDDWDNFIWQVRWAVTESWPSFYECDKWDGREEHRILESGLARIVVCNYAGVASINLAILDDLWKYTPDLTPLAEHWCQQIADRFYAEMGKHFD